MIPYPESTGGAPSHDARVAIELGYPPPLTLEESDYLGLLDRQSMEWAEHAAENVRAIRLLRISPGLHVFFVFASILSGGLALPIYVACYFFWKKRKVAHPPNLELLPQINAAVMNHAHSGYLWIGRADLLEPRKQPNQYARSSSGASIGIGPVRVGGGDGRTRVIAGAERQTAVDRGEVRVTSSHVYFKGSKYSQHWKLDQLDRVSYTKTRDTVIFYESGRRGKVKGLKLGKSGHEFSLFLDLALMPNQEARIRACRAAELMVRQRLWPSVPPR